MYTDSTNTNTDFNAAFDVIYSHQGNYFNQFRDRLLSKGFNTVLYEDENSVMSILEEGLRYFAELFEEWCITNFRNPQDIGQILWLYSLYERDKNNGIISLSELDIIGLYTCRYILAIAPKLSLSVNVEPYFEDKNIWLPELFAITNSLMSLSQFRSIVGLSKTPLVNVDLSNQFCVIDIINPDFSALLNKSKSKGERILAPQYVDYSVAIRFTDLLTDVFGNAADSLINIFTSNSIPNENTDDVTPKDFTPYYSHFGSSIFARELVLDLSSVNFYNVITKPHSNNYRTRFKPLIKLTVDGNPLYISSKWLIFEAISELCINRVPFNGLPKSWLAIDRIRTYADETSNEVGSKFESLVASRISKEFPFEHDIKSIGNTPIETSPVYENGVPTGRTVGQIDFIIINREKGVIFIADAKHLKSKYIVSSFYNDKSKFDNYYIKLQDKVEWAKNNKSLISTLFGFDVSSFEVQELFITDAYIFYALFVDYPIIPLIAINSYLSSVKRLCYLD